MSGVVFGIGSASRARLPSSSDFRNLLFWLSSLTWPALLVERGSVPFRAFGGRALVSSRGGAACLVDRLGLACSPRVGSDPVLSQSGGLRPFIGYLTLPPPTWRFSVTLLAPRFPTDF